MKTFSVPVTFAFLVASGFAACSSSTNAPDGLGPATNSGAGGTGVGGSSGTGGTSGGVSGSGGSGGSGGPVDGGTDAGSLAGTVCPLTRVYSPPCNPLGPSGPLVVSTCSSSEPPQTQGGTIADGTYFLESATWYGTCQPETKVHSTRIICGDLWNVGSDVLGSDAGVAHTNYLAAPQATTVILNPLCNSQGTAYGIEHGFSAFGGKLMMTTTYGFSVLVTVYALQ
jgi:hypothetical protein